jgi:hypothetical protein
MLLKSRRLACAAPAELDTDAVRNGDSGKFDSDTSWPLMLGENILIILNREVAGTLVRCAIEYGDEICISPEASMVF